MPTSDLMLFYNGKFTTLLSNSKEVTVVAVQNGKFFQIGNDAEILKLRANANSIIDLKGRRVIPGLIDSHLHVIRGGLNYNMELRWDGVDLLAVALRMLKEQVQRTPAPQWVRVVGGFTEKQFREKRLPTIAELNQVAPETPVFILHLYDRALLNQAAVRVCGFGKDSPNPPGGIIERDERGNPTGILIADPNAMILYSTLAKGRNFQSNIRKTLLATSCASLIVSV